MEKPIENPFIRNDKLPVITPKNALQLLKEGNLRFVNNKTLDRDLIRLVEKTATGQFPFAAILSCIDSRVPAEVVFDQGIGDIFSTRIAGNFVNDDILGSLEFACKLIGSKIILVLGHTSCGAVKGACDNIKLGNLTQMLAKIKPAVKNIKTKKGESRTSENITFVDSVAEENVRLTIENIKYGSKVLNQLYSNNEIDIVGAMYDVKTGIVEFFS